MKYYINDEVVSEEQFNKQLEEDIRDEDENTFDDLLDDCYESYSICGITLLPSEILYKADPVCYNMALDDQINSDLSDAKWVLNQGDEYISGRDTFKIVDEEEMPEQIPNVVD